MCTSCAPVGDSHTWFNQRNATVQSGTVMMPPNIIRDRIHHCSDRGRIEMRFVPTKYTPELARHGVSFWRKSSYNGTKLYLELYYFVKPITPGTGVAKQKCRKLCLCFRRLSTHIVAFTAQCTALKSSSFVVITTPLLCLSKLNYNIVWRNEYVTNTIY